MPRELITVQIGQCGIQLGSRFWDLALREHANYSKKDVYDESLSSFFRNVDSRTGRDLPFYSSLTATSSTAHTVPLASLKARALLIDMEEGVINNLMKSELRDLFDMQQTIRDVSGAGNNWAHGHEQYGPQYGSQILDTVQKAVESCDSLQSFFFMHSLGGGTGSGLGTYILEQFADHYPDIYRFTTCVFPSSDDDVVTSPYNSMLSLSKLIEYADCVLPIENEALIDICQRVNKPTGKSTSETTHVASSIVDVYDAKHGGNAKKQSAEKVKAFDDMNTIAAHVLTNLTASMRFEGSLNTDLNEITMNLVPFPRMHFLLSSVAPLYVTQRQLITATSQPRSIDQIFTDSLARQNQLIRCTPTSDSYYLACGMLARGSLTINDLNRNITRIKSHMSMIHWNPDGFKVGLCSVPPVGHPYSLLTLSNHTCIAQTFQEITNRFVKLYGRKAHLHHYTEYMDVSLMDSSYQIVQDLIAEYQEVGHAPVTTTQRMTPLL